MQEKYVSLSIWKNKKKWNTDYDKRIKPKENLLKFIVSLMQIIKTKNYKIESVSISISRID